MSMSFLDAAVESKRPFKARCPTQRESRPEVARGSRKDDRVALSKTAPMIGCMFPERIDACFPRGSPTSKAGIEELIAEAAEAASNDFSVDAANESAEGYTFSPEFKASDVCCLRAAQLNFRKMVERGLKILSMDRLS